MYKRRSQVIENRWEKMGLPGSTGPGNELPASDLREVASRTTVREGKVGPVTAKISGKSNTIRANAKSGVPGRELVLGGGGVVGGFLSFWGLGGGGGFDVRGGGGVWLSCCSYVGGVGGGLVVCFFGEICRDIFGG